jgi:hypothetical protein
MAMKNVTLRFEAEELQHLRNLASARGQSMSKLVTDLVAEHLELQEHPFSRSAMSGSLRCKYGEIEAE